MANLFPIEQAENRHKCYWGIEMGCDFCGAYGCVDCLGSHKIPWIEEPTVEPLIACNECFEKMENERKKA